MGTCEITALDRDMSHPKRMIARQTARCACRRGQVAGTTKAKPACVDGKKGCLHSCLIAPKIHQSGPRGPAVSYKWLRNIAGTHEGL